MRRNGHFFSAETEFSEKEKAALLPLNFNSPEKALRHFLEAFQGVRRKSSQADDVNVFGILEDFSTSL